MKFFGRLKFYLIGFGIGLIAALIMFKGRGCEWLPNERVLNSIRSSRIFYTEKSACLMENYGIEKKDIFLMLENGDVNFSESDTKGDVKLYVIEHNDHKFSFSLNPRDSIVVLEKFLSESENNSCDSLDNENLLSLYMPSEMILEKLRMNELRLEKTMACELECNHLTEKDVDEMLQSGRILFDESYPERRPNPIYFIEYMANNSRYVFWVAQGKTKTRVYHVIDITEIDLSDGSYLVDKVFEQDICDCGK